MPSLIHNFSAFRSEFTNLEMTFSADYPIISPQDADGVIAVVTPETAPANIDAAFKSLAKVLGVQFNNYCDVIYDSEGQLIWAGLPQIATYRNPATGTLEPALIIGTSRTDKAGRESPYVFSQTFIPLEYKDDDYLIMGSKVNLHTQPNPTDNTKPPIVLLKLEVKRGDTFYFRLRTKLEYPELKEAFDNGRFATVLDSIESHWFSATNFLKPTIESNQFPSEGVFLLLNNPRYSSNLYNGTLLESISFNVLKTSHSNLKVQTSAKTPVVLLSGDVTNIKFNANSKAFSAYKAGMYDGKQHILLHFIRPSEDNNGVIKSDHTPVHSIGCDMRVFLPSAKAKFTQMLDGEVLINQLPEPKIVNMKSAAVSELDDFAEIPF